MIVGVSFINGKQKSMNCFILGMCMQERQNKLVHRSETIGYIEKKEEN